MIKPHYDKSIFWINITKFKQVHTYACGISYMKNLLLSIIELG